MPSSPNILIFPRASRSAIILAVGLLVTAFLSLGAHDLAIAHLGVPYPDESVVPTWVKYIGQVVRIATMVYVCRLASWYFDRRTTVAAAIIFGLLIIFLQETLRVIVVDNIISNGWIDFRWLYLLSTRLPNAMVSFFSGAAAVVIARKLHGKRLATTLVAILFFAALGQLALLPAMKWAAASTNAALGLVAAPEVHQMPYGLYVYKYIYGMFIEPTIASYILTGLLWPALPGSTARRVVLFVFLLLLIRGRVIATGVFIFWLPLPLPAALAAEGQFFIETFILAALTAGLRAILNPVKSGNSTG